MKIHFIGIGGIGMSSLAQYYLAKGHEVTGSDLVASEITDFLKERGIRVVVGNYPEYIKKDFDLVVYSPAVPKDNPELIKAKSYLPAEGSAQAGKLKVKSYPEALGELTKEHFTIAVAGSHGKSTTTAIIGLILAKAGLDPTVIVGTKLKEFSGSNFRAGKSSFLVIEACEYDDSFLNYSPKILVVTNVDKEHLDYFKTFSNVVKAFKNFILKLPGDGFLVANKDDSDLKKIINSQLSLTRRASRRLIINKFSIKQFSIKQEEASRIKKILKIPGQHNISNALAALAVARILNVPDKITFKALSEYKGSWRRFEIKTAELRGNLPFGFAQGEHKKTRKITIVSDYGHHPNEISATLKAAREKYPKQKIWCIFQPHQYQRTHYLFKDFVKVFRNVPTDEIIITDIYDVAGREEKKISSSVNSKSLAEKINRSHVKYMNVDDAEKYVKGNIKSGEVLMIMGAGDIYKLVEKF